MANDCDKDGPCWVTVMISIRLVRLASAAGLLPWILHLTAGTRLGQSIAVLHTLSELDDIDELI